jgi:hypothetical protein
MIRFTKYLCFLIFICLGRTASAQEMVMPLQENKVVRARSQQPKSTALKPTSLTIPFFEDFTDNDPYPNPSRWADKEVYINNTMGTGMISRGVATFDALNEKGQVYYDSVDAYTTIYADSLTSLDFDLSTHQVADSVYLSFFYERGGFGFFPKPTDSLMLYFLTSTGVWKKVWALQGDTTQTGFKQVMIPLNDTGYFHSNFKMRWLNMATIGVSNSNWDIDYIKMDAGRTWSDTTVKDVAFTSNPANILNDFTAMPFRHFKTNPATFLATNVEAYVRNNGNQTSNTKVNYTASDQTTGTSLGLGNTTVTIAQNNDKIIDFPMYNAGGFNPANANGRVVYNEQFYCNATYPNESQDNDTISYQQVFDNYFAYDDGTAELSYFLNLIPNAPGVTAIEYALYQTDTIQGVAIQFARTQPSQAIKDFSIAVYSNIAVNGGNDSMVYQEDYFVPSYVDTINSFYVYRFEHPVKMNAGQFFIGIIQPAGGVSDSLQIALDANRVGGNHRYFRVDQTWQSSTLDGALMVRPLVGADLPLAINNPKQPNIAFNLFPNPATQFLNITLNANLPKASSYQIVDVVGRKHLSGKLETAQGIDIHALPAGVYFFRIENDGQFVGVKKFVKM